MPVPFRLPVLDPQLLLDLLLPISLVAVVFGRQGDPPGMVLTLVLWLALRFWLRAKARPLYWILLGVLFASLATLVSQPALSSPTDLILVLLAFSAGLGRGRQDWTWTLWILAGAGLVALLCVRLDRVNDNLAFIPWQGLRAWLPAEAVRLGGITINRSAYILGLLTLCGWALFRHGSRGWARVLVLAMTALAYGLAFCTGSRAGAGLPLIVVAIAELAWRCRRWLPRLSRSLPVAFLALALLFNVALYHPWSPLAYRTINETGRADVAQCFFKQSLSSPLEFVVGHGGDLTNTSCLRSTRPLPGRSVGPPHAHNVFLQMLADNGVLCFGFFLVLIACSLRQALLLMAADDGLQGCLALTVGLFVVSFGLVESTLLQVSLQQVLTGYLLAAAWPPPAPSVPSSR